MPICSSPYPARALSCFRARSRYLRNVRPAAQNHHPVEFVQQAIYTVSVYSQGSFEFGKELKRDLLSPRALMVMEEYQGLGYRSNELQQLQLQLATAYLPMRSIDAVINVMYLSNSLLLTSIFRFLPFCLHLPLCFCPNNKIDALCLCSIKKARGSLLSVPFLVL